MGWFFKEKSKYSGLQKKEVTTPDVLDANTMAAGITVGM